MSLEAAYSKVIKEALKPLEDDIASLRRELKELLDSREEHKEEKRQAEFFKKVAEQTKNELNNLRR